MKLKTSLLAITLLLLVTAVPAQRPAPWQDDLVDRLSGSWKMTGDVMTHPAHHDIKAEWVFNHQFLRIEEKTSAAAPETEQKYDAVWYLGYDTSSDRYVLHLMDQFGGRFSETLGYGTREGNTIKFIFEYPDGPFHTTFRYDPEKQTWQWLMEQKDKTGKWSTFADLKLSR